MTLGQRVTKRPDGYGWPGHARCFRPIGSAADDTEDLGTRGQVSVAERRERAGVIGEGMPKGEEAAPRVP